jgi:hypothetical protein
LAGTLGKKRAIFRNYSATYMCIGSILGAREGGIPKLCRGGGGRGVFMFIAFLVHNLPTDCPPPYFAGCDLNSMWDKRRLRRLRRLNRYVVNCGTKFKSHPAK